jgi:hypothetical protein
MQFMTIEQIIRAILADGPLTRGELDTRLHAVLAEEYDASETAPALSRLAAAGRAGFDSESKRWAIPVEDLQ